MWQWLYALVCISQETGFSSSPVRPVMMSHVPVYQTRRIQLSPHLLLSQSPVPLPLVFIFLPLRRLSSTTMPHTRRRLFLWSVPAARLAPQERLSLYLQTHSSRQTLLWLRDSAQGKARMALTTQRAALISGPS